MDSIFWGKSKKSVDLKLKAASNMSKSFFGLFEGLKCLLNFLNISVFCILTSVQIV